MQDLGVRDPKAPTTDRRSVALLPFSDVWQETGWPKSTAYRNVARGDMTEFGARRIGERYYVIESVWRQFFPEPEVVVPPEPDPPPPLPPSQTSFSIPG